MSEITEAEAEELWLRANGSDRQWWNAYGMCGGCGDSACHPDVGCTPGWLEGCRYCPNKTKSEDRLTPPVKRQAQLEGQQDILEMLQ